MTSAARRVFKMRIFDIHTHGIGGYDTASSAVKDILKIAEIHGSHGVSDILLSIYPDSIDKMRRQMETVRKAMEKQKEEGGMQKTDSQRRPNIIHPTSQSAKILGLHLEGPFLNPLRCGALMPSTFIEPTEYNLRRLIEGFEDTIRVITIAPELKGALEIIRRIADSGIIASMGHSDATLVEAEAGYNSGARGITHIFNAMREIHHREPGIAGFGLLNEDIYIEVIADPFHLHPKTIEMIFRVKNNDRIIVISDSVKQTKPHSGKNSIKGIDDTLQGGCMTLTGSSERLADIGIDRGVIMSCTSGNPGRYLNIPV